MATHHQLKSGRVKNRYHVMVKPGGPICNLDCGYCYYLKKTELYPGETRFRMDEPLLEKFIRGYIASHPGPNVVFPWHGGEPTMLGIDFFKKAVAFQKQYLPPGWKCINVPQTNGSLLDEKWCEFFVENDFAIGISIDGPAAIHDTQRPDKRGRPTHQKVMHGLHLLQQYRVPYTVLCTVNSQSVQSPLEIYRFFREHGVTAMQFLPIVGPLGGGEVSQQTVPAAEYGRFLTVIFEEWLRRDLGVVWVQIFEECLAKVRGNPGMLCLFQETCGDSLAMEHNGDLFACDHFVVPEWKLGNLNERTMKAMVESPQMKQFARAKRDTLPAFCLSCDVKFMCNGGCPKDRFINTPDGEPGLNYLCEGLGGFFRHARARLEAIVPNARSAGKTASQHSPAAATASSNGQPTGRNDPCPCGSGLKYKKCCQRLLPGKPTAVRHG